MQQQQPPLIVAAAAPPPASTSVASNLLFSSFGEFVKRSLMVFVFWFLIGGVLAFAYNVSVSRVYTCRENGDPIDEDELFLRQLDDHQMFAFAIGLGVTAVTGRILLEFIASNFGRDNAAIVSGQAIVMKPELEKTAENILEADDDARQQQQQLVQPPPQQPTPVAVAQPPPVAPQQVQPPVQQFQAPPPPAAFARGPAY